MADQAPAPAGTDPLVAALVAEAEKTDFVLQPARIAHWKKQLAAYPKRQAAGAC